MNTTKWRRNVDREGTEREGLFFGLFGLNILLSLEFLKLYGGVGRVGYFCWEGGYYLAMLFLLLFFLFVMVFIWLREK